MPAKSKKKTQKKSTSSKKKTKKVAKKTAKKAVKKSVKKAVKKAAKKQVKKAVKKTVKKSPSKAKKAVKKSPAKKAVKKSKVTKAKTKKVTKKTTAKKKVTARKKSPAKPAKPAKPKKLDPAVRKIRDQLIQERNELLNMIRSNREVERNVGELTFSNEIDLASSLEGREMAFQLSSRERNELKMIEEALLKIETGDYGVCVDCPFGLGPKAIGIKRLQIMPLTTLCVECQEAVETNQPGPIQRP
ncbi:MAG: TraR/DksA family transcriptional regulator [Candidatus Nitronauta litoralis]|uniref:TraR/DksA family transcriptional regulator n=1 Tax=Candidatus Nitronauta litoralis TaxID=2705533 RepID=A0A7T0BYX9_9BACT|nr:MAG: TraR/DksA family transcriptional regulator [Candidatus Nitronauta litoralis]